jgi:hypothetical protein
MFVACFLVWIFFDPEDGGSKFLRNVYENLKFYIIIFQNNTYSDNTQIKINLQVLLLRFNHLKHKFYMNNIWKFSPYLIAP